MTPSNPAADVRVLVEAWIDAIRRRDLDAVVASHAEEVVFYDVPEPAELRGIEAYRRSWKDFLGWVTSFEMDGLDVHAGDDIAFCHVIVRCAGRTEPDPFLVRLTMGLRRLEDGWLITHEHHSVPASA